ncbi:MAG: PAS domain S-box protein [Candidatus Lokiarchaeota archaeon]|nr:PAS domain S-box protein [Candidatus Lokiarchaeota archaeon]
MLNENNQTTSRKVNPEYFEILVFSVALLFTIISRIYSYLLFHSIAEVFSIVIAGGVFFVGWNSRRYMENSFFLVLGVSSLFIGIIDLIHTLSYSGMAIFTGFSPNLPTSLWIAARYLQAISCLLASLLIKRIVKPIILIVSYLGATILLVVLIFVKLFPLCYIDGLTPFKIVSEYIIILILLICLLIIFKQKIEFDKRVLILMFFSIISTMIAELAFTFYIDVYDVSNLLGHIFKIIAFYLLYKSIIQIGIKEPFNLLFRKIRRSELELKNIIKHSGAGITMLNENGDYLLVNEKAANELGGKPEDFVGKSLFDVLPKEVAEEYFNSNRELIQSGNSRSYQRTFNQPSGRKTYWIVEQPLKDIDEKLSSLLSVATDITERKKAEERLSQLVSTVSHELRTPITVLMMSIDYLSKHKEDFDKDLEEKLMGGIMRNIYLLNELAEDILLIMRIDENRLKLELKEYSPLEIINDILYLLEPIGKEKNIQFEINIDDSLYLKGDPKRIDQIFRIIIDNAIKYSLDNSKIEVEAIMNYQGKYNSNENPGVLFKFRDYGRGIPKEDLPHIFERFFRASNVNEIAGTGLGLAIAKDLIEAHNGEVYIDSELEKGTTFIVFLPRI